MQGATRYRFEGATDPAFSLPLIDSSLTDTTAPARGLAENRTYWSRVRAYNAAGWGPYRTVRTLTAVRQAPVPVVLISPSQGAVLHLVSLRKLLWMGRGSRGANPLDLTRELGRAVSISLTSRFRTLIQDLPADQELNSHPRVSIFSWPGCCPHPTCQTLSGNSTEQTKKGEDTSCFQTGAMSLNRFSATVVRAVSTLPSWEQRILRLRAGIVRRLEADITVCR